MLYKLARTFIGGHITLHTASAMANHIQGITQSIFIAATHHYVNTFCGQCLGGS
jgi:hypothetical protein